MDNYEERTRDHEARDDRLSVTVPELGAVPAPIPMEEEELESMLAE